MVANSLLSGPTLAESWNPTSDASLDNVESGSPPASETPAETAAWQIPAECGDQNDVLDAIRRSLDRRDFEQVPPDVRVNLRISRSQSYEPSSATWTLDLIIAAPNGQVTRQLQDHSCKTLIKAAGIIIAVALDPLWVADELEDNKAEALPDTQQPEVIVEQPTVDPTKNELHLYLSAAGGTEAGFLSQPGAAALLSFGLGKKHFHIETSGLYAAPRDRKPYEAQPDAGGRFQMGGVALRACGRLTTKRLESLSCGGAEGGLARVEGIGLDEPKVSHRPWAGLLLTQVFSIWFHPQWAVAARVEGEYLLERARFRVDDLGPLHRVGPLSLRFFLGVTWRIH